MTHRVLPSGTIAKSTWRIERALDYDSPAQRTEAWHNLRRNHVTGSLIDTIMGTNKYAGPAGRDKAMLIKAGMPDDFTGNAATRHGTLYEPIAIAKYEAVQKRKVFEVGLIPHPDMPLLAHSPDGLSLADGDSDLEPCLLEVKCPFSRKIKPGIVPECYINQIQMGMNVFGVNYAHFVEYKRATSTTAEEYVITRVERDHNWLQKAEPVVCAWWAGVEHYRKVGWTTHPSMRKHTCLVPDDD